MSELTETSQLNGVNVEQLVGTINAIKNDPSIADFKFSATTTWIKGGHCQTKVQSFSGANMDDTSRTEPFILEGDEPPVLLGENHGTNAVETLLHALGSCLSVGIIYNAAARGINIKSLNFDLDGEIDLHAFLGLSKILRSGYSNINVKINIDSDAPQYEINTLCKYVEETSPLLDCIRNPVPVNITIA